MENFSLLSVADLVDCHPVIGEWMRFSLMRVHRHFILAHLYPLSGDDNPSLMLSSKCTVI